MTAVDELLGRMVSMRALALLRVVAGPVVLLHLRPFLSGRVARADLPRRVLRALRRLVPGPAARRSTSGCSGSRRWPRSPWRSASSPAWRRRRRSRSSPTTCSSRRRTSTTTGPISSSCSGCWPRRRADGSCPWTRGSAAVAAGRRSTPRAPAWPLWLLRFECAAVYAASGMSKLLDPDWFGGTVSWQRVVQARDELEGWPLPGWVVSVLTDRGLPHRRREARRS